MFSYVNILGFDNFFEAILSCETGLLLASLPFVKPKRFIPWKITSSSVNAQNALIKRRNLRFGAPNFSWAVGP